MNNKVIIGIAGEIGSGKGTLAQYLKDKYNAQGMKFSDPLRDIAKRMYLEENRENLQLISTIFRQGFSEDILSNVLMNDVKSSTSKIIVIDGIRRESDMEAFKKDGNLKLIYIETDLEIRYKRITTRDEKTDDNSKTFEEFKKDHEREADTQVRGLKNIADFVIENNGTLEDLQKAADEVVKKLVY